MRQQTTEGREKRPAGRLDLQTSNLLKLSRLQPLPAMNSLAALSDLRAAKFKKEQRRVQCAEVKRQYEVIKTLQRKKELLSARLQALSQGMSVEEFDYPEEDLRYGRNTLCTLKEKLYAYRLIGPCGLSVAEVGNDRLVVTFTPVWKNTAESYILKIVAVNGKVKERDYNVVSCLGEETGAFMEQSLHLGNDLPVYHLPVSGTNIPYFIDVQSILDKSKSPDWLSLMDDIGYLLNAYIQRKGELSFVMESFKDCIKLASPNESLTCIEITVSQTDRQTKLSKDICVYLVYAGVDCTLPDKVIITTENIIVSSQITSALRQKFLLFPLSDVISDVLDVIKASKVLSPVDENDESDES